MRRAHHRGPWDVWYTVSDFVSAYWRGILIVVAAFAVAVTVTGCSSSAGGIDCDF